MKSWRNAPNGDLHEARKSQIANGDWLPDMDLNHDKQIQSLLCYRYTIGQAGAGTNLEFSRQESSC
jgi:hypothetical protein